MYGLEVYVINSVVIFKQGCTRGSMRVENILFKTPVKKTDYNKLFFF